MKVGVVSFAKYEKVKHKEVTDNTVLVYLPGKVKSKWILGNKKLLAYRKCLGCNRRLSYPRLLCYLNFHVRPKDDFIAKITN